MKYNFDEDSHRAREDGSYSSKWSPNGPFMASMFQSEEVPEDRRCFFAADMDFRCAPQISAAIQKVACQAHIGLSDGKGMGTPDGTIFRRFCCTSPKSVIVEAVDRLVACMQ